MEKDGLLSSKSYGLATDLLWQINQHPINKQLGFTAPPLIHALFYTHEMIRGEIFTALYLTDLLQEWKPEETIIQNRCDALVWWADVKIYLEIETGSQGKQKLLDKINEYKQYWQNTQERFEVVFAMADKEAVESIVKLFSETRVPYLAVVQEDLALNTLQALLKSRLKTWSLLELSKAWIVPNTD